MSLNSCACRSVDHLIFIDRLLYPKIARPIAFHQKRLAQPGRLGAGAGPGLAGGGMPVCDAGEGGEAAVKDVLQRNAVCRHERLHFANSPRERLTAFSQLRLQLRQIGQRDLVDRDEALGFDQRELAPALHAILEIHTLPGSIRCRLKGSWSLGRSRTRWWSRSKGPNGIFALTELAPVVPRKLSRHLNLEDSALKVGCSRHGQTLMKLLPQFSEVARRGVA